MKTAGQIVSQIIFPTILTILTILMLSFIGCSGQKNETPYSEPGFRSSIRNYQSCEELQSDVRETLEANRLAALHYAETFTGPTAIPVFASPTCTEAAPQPDILTNLQEEGIDEADFTKVGPEQIFVSIRGKIKVIERNSLRLLSSLSLDPKIRYQLLIDRDRLIATGTRSEQTGARTEVRVFELRSGLLPLEIKSLTYEGYLKDHRMKNGMLVLVTESGLSLTRPLHEWSQDPTHATPTQPIRLVDGAIAGVPCTQIQQSAARDVDTRFTQILVRNIRNLNVPESRMGWIGGSDFLYVGEKNIYLTKTNFRFYGYSPTLENAASYDKTAVTSVMIDEQTGTLKDARFGLVEGWIKDPWALKELSQRGENYLAIATTTFHSRQFVGNSGVMSNHLFVMAKHGQGALQIASRVDDFGLNEDIRAVRYKGDYAYIVTFEKTDPLYAINLSDPTHAVLEGELQVPGFSMYLHPVAGGKMIGVGFDALPETGFSWFQGLQVSLFDVSHSNQMSRLDSKIIGDRGSSSEATGDHHAFYYDELSGLIGLPALELKRTKPNAHPSEFGDELNFVGAHIYRLSDKLELAARISHQNLLQGDCKKFVNSHDSWWQHMTQSPDVRRIFKVDGRLMTISNFGIKTHSVTDPGTELSALSLVTDSSECPDAD